MKKYIVSTICLVIAVFMLSGCDGNQGERLEYIAVQLSEDDSWSIIDKNGKVVVEEEYPADATISYIYDGVYWVKSGDKYQLFSVDQPKKPIIDEEFNDVTTFFQLDRAAVSSDIHQPIRIIDTKGKTIATLPKSVRTCFYFTKDGYAVYCDKNNQKGLIDSKGKIAVKASFFNIVGVVDGVSLAQKEYDDGKYRIIDTKGKQVGAFSSSRYELVNGEFHEGKLIVKDANSNNPNYYAFNKKGEKMFTLSKKVKEIESTAHYIDGYLVFKGNDGKYGILDEKGEVQIRAKYNTLLNYGKGEFAAQKGDKWGVINANDESIIDFDYDNCIQSAMKNALILMEGKDYLVVDKEGKDQVSFRGIQAMMNPLVIYIKEEAPKDEGNALDFPEDDIICDYGQIGLLGALPEGTTHYIGDMGGYPIEFTITNKPDKGELSALYKNVNYGTTMKMIGESLPAQGGEISFFGEENGRQWSFNLDGDADNITGTAYGSNDYQFKVKMKRR